MDRLINYYAINLSLNLASKHVKDGNTELVLHHLNEIELLMEELMEEVETMKEPNVVELHLLLTDQIKHFSERAREQLLNELLAAVAMDKRVDLSELMSMIRRIDNFHRKEGFSWNTL